MIEYFFFRRPLINDASFVSATRAATWEKDPVKQKELFDKVNEDLIQPHVERVEKHMTENGTGFLVGNAVSTLNKET